MEPKKILLINDLAGYGKVALSAMIPILSHMKYQVYNLPTAIVSNTLDYGKFEILDTTDYMKNTLQVWEKLGFHFDLICTGFITSYEQAEMVLQYCIEQRKYGTHIIVDPIMGDDGKLYNGISESTVDCMRKLCSMADICVPNLTEACLIAGENEIKDNYTESELLEILSRIMKLGCKSVVITSASVDGNNCTVIKECMEDAAVMISYEEIPVRFPGTGDIFTSIIAGKFLQGSSLQDAAASAMDSVKYLISQNTDNMDKYKGIPIERYLADMPI